MLVDETTLHCRLRVRARGASARRSLGATRCGLLWTFVAALSMLAMCQAMGQAEALAQAGASAGSTTSGSAAKPTPPPATDTLGGYVVAGKGTASLDFTVPKFTCPRTATGSIEVGVAAADIGGNSGEAIISLTCKVPAPAVLVAEAVSYCAGSATKTTMFPVLAGNKMSLSVSPTGVATVDDLTRNATSTVTGCSIAMKKAIYGVFCPRDWTIPYPPPQGTPACTILPRFSKLAFSAAALDAKAIGKSKPTAFMLQLTPHEVTPGPIGSTGATFADAYK